MIPSALRAWKRLGARYDLAALQPPNAAFAVMARAARGRPVWRSLRRWCLAGTQAPSLRLSVAVLEHADARRAHALAHALCLERDGSLQLLGCRSAAERLALRLKTKLHDVMPGRQRQPTDAWDAGLLPGTASALQALARFEPRRATLLVALGLPVPTLRAICALLHARQPFFDQPVRLLLVPGAPGLQLGWPAKRILLSRGAKREVSKAPQRAGVPA